MTLAASGGVITYTLLPAARCRPHPPAGRFALYNVLGALLWCVLFLGAGFFFGNLPGKRVQGVLCRWAFTTLSLARVCGSGSKMCR
jgi:hypothetical protein